MLLLVVLEGGKSTGKHSFILLTLWLCRVIPVGKRGFSRVL